MISIRTALCALLALIATAVGAIGSVSWHPRMILNGHGGGHTGIHAPHFLIHEVAPWLRD